MKLPFFFKSSQTSPAFFMDILMFSLPTQVVVVHKPKQSTVAREKVNILPLTNIKLQHKEKCFELIKVLQMLFLMPQTVKVQKK